MSDIDSSRNMVSTLVFMDLESTGLPSFEGRRNVHITEMSLVAIGREDFETDDTFRVLNKLSLCIQPRTSISPTAMAITRLYNDNLERQEKFDDSIAKLLEYFFRRLKRPLCLLAHNGKRFDFPLLQAEMRNINYALDPEILCADTWEAFRSIVSNESDIDPPLIENNEESLVKETDSNKTDAKVGSIKRSLSEDDMDKLLSDDIDLFTAIKEPIIHNISTDNSSRKLAPCQNNPFLNDFTTPKSNNTNSTPVQNSSKKIKRDPTWLPSNQYKTSTPKAKYNCATSPNSLQTHVKRQLFENGASVKLPSSKPTGFSLQKLYFHYFGESPPQSHYAEADCIALSKVCQKISKDFLKWIDEHSTSFSETTAMW